MRLLSNPKTKITLVSATLVLALLVIMLGAYTRLKNAGLGCPDWPGCYGFLTVPQSEEAQAIANNTFPHRPLEIEKAWPEMIHRYFAGSLGVLILGIFSYFLYLKTKHRQTSLKLPTVLLGLVIFQAILGMWTVTMGLFPTVVTSHLIAGFSTFALLMLLLSKSILEQKKSYFEARPIKIIKPETITRLSLKSLSLIGLILLFAQIILGGWTASNYAGLACTVLPICEGAWWQQLQVFDAFTLFGHSSTAYEYAQHITPQAKRTIHVFHRVGAIAVTSYLSYFFFTLYRSCSAQSLGNTIIKKWVICCLLLLIVQVTLGIANIIFQMPLFVAVIHNANAALLFAAQLSLHFFIRQSSLFSLEPERDFHYAKN